MKVYFERATSASHQESGYTKLWDNYIACLKQEATCHSITDNIRAADVVIDNSIESLESRAVASLLRPLSITDVRRFVWDWGDRPTGRSSGFYCSLDSSLFNHMRHRTVHYPIAFNDLVDEYPTCDAIYDYGFMGGVSAGLRARLVDFLKRLPMDSRRIVKVTEFNWSKAFHRNGNAHAKSEYVEFLRRTRFVLCPRGYGLGTARLFETLRAGRVPIIISDGYIPPSGIDWESCSIRIAERDIHMIPDVVRNHMPRWETMARCARDVWYQNFSHENFFRYLTENLDAMLANIHWPSPIEKTTFMANTALAVTSQHLRPYLGRIRDSILQKQRSGNLLGGNRL